MPSVMYNMKGVFFVIVLIVFLSSVKATDVENQIFTFIHISDTHLSKLPNVVRNRLFSIFAEKIVPMISPDLVVHSGDITDGWIKGKMSGEIEEEWKLYHSVLSQNNLFNNTIWLDVRGNHDSSNQDSSTNHCYFNYSTCGSLGPVFNRVYERPFGRYCFVGMDSTLSPSPGVLMTYFGYVTNRAQSKLRYLLTENNKHCNHTILFTHYPTMYLNTPSLQSIYSHSPPSFILSGHVHSTLGSKANAKLNSNTLELVIRDFKIRNIFRLMIIDNDYLNYVDCSVNETLSSPILLITNPPNSQLYTYKQSLQAQPSTHYIHLFLYDFAHQHRIQTDGIVIHIDQQLLPNKAFQSSTPHLFYIPWNASAYQTGLHSITVTYTHLNHSVQYSHEFILTPYTPKELVYVNTTLSYSSILDALSPGFNFGGYLINSTLSLILITLSYSIPLILVALLVIARKLVLKLIPVDDISGVQQRFRVADFIFHSPLLKGYPMFFKRWLLIASDRPITRFITYSLLWQIFGIWTIGRFPTELGIQFLWGTFFLSPPSGSYVLWLDCFFWHLLSLAVFWIPMFFYYGSIMIPEGLLGQPSKQERAVTAVAHCLWFGYYAGCMVVVKLYFVWETYNAWVLLTSPVWCWFGIIQCGLMLREFVYQANFVHSKQSMKLLEPSESLIVSSIVY